MKSPGTMLREARESRGLSLPEASALTRVPRATLTHLEQDRFDEFQAPVFAKGHLRNYARDLGLDPEVVLRAYEAQTRGPVAPVPMREEKGKSEVKTLEAPDFAAVFEEIARHIRPTHMLAVALVLTGVVVFASLLSGTRATAKDPADFPTSSQQEWDLEQEAQETRWLLEEPSNSRSSR